MAPHNNVEGLTFSNAHIADWCSSLAPQPYLYQIALRKNAPCRFFFFLHLYALLDCTGNLRGQNKIYCYIEPNCACLNIATTDTTPAYIVAKLFCIAFLLTALTACGEHKRVGEKEVVAAPVDIDVAAADIIETTLDDGFGSNPQLKNIKLYDPEVVTYFYEQADYKPLWSKKGVFTVAADSLFYFIRDARSYGLFPQDYSAGRLDTLRQQVRDTTKDNGLDASKWAESDLLFTTAYINIIKDLKKGRLIADSVLKRDSSLSAQFYHQQWLSYGGNMEQLAATLEPKQLRYAELKKGLQQFLRQAKFGSHTYVNPRDSVRQKSLVIQRLSEEDSITFSAAQPDSFALSAAIKKYQSLNGLKETGKISGGLIAHLNNTDDYKFARIAVNMDRYKGLQSLPDQYIWVNIPSYKLQLWDSGFVALTSKVVVGKPQTRTPQLTSAISDLITYPKWHIPQSIIKKEILPALKRDPGYLARKGYSLVDTGGNEVDPYAVTWSKYENGIPYTVVQGSGDDNALGVLKFNFPNKYAVYLHDTNQRYLFSREKRALSHGCVRVDAWQELATYILERDNAASANAVPLDSMYTWLALKEKHLIPVRKKLPVFIRYFTCAADDGELVFYDDVYDEDRQLINLFFKTK